MDNNGFRKIFFSVPIIVFPAPLMATRGPDDYGMIAAFAMLLYYVPACLSSIGFIVFSISRLKKAVRPVKGQGRIVFILSLFFAVMATALSFAIMHLSEWNEKMIESMLVIAMPVLVLAVLSAVLSARVKKRAE